MQVAYASLPPPSLKLPNPNPKAKVCCIAASYPPKTPQTKTTSQHYHGDRDTDDGVDNPVRVKFPLPPTNVNCIVATSNPFVRHCVKLIRSSAYRHSHASAVVVGATPIREIHKSQESLEEKTVEIECLFLLDNIEVPEGLTNCSPRVLRVSSFVMKKLSQLQSTECTEAIALMKFPSTYFLLDDGRNNEDCRKWFPSPHRILVLERIQDPGNLGTLLRSAVAFKWSGVFLLPGCCDPFNVKVLRASRGASFQIPIVSGDWHHLEALKHEFQMKMLGGHPDSSDELKPVVRLSQAFADGLADVPLCLVLGNEARGLSDQAQQDCELISIPMAGEFESLNVAVAGGIFLYMLQSENRRIV
ncbi:hypothetical protein Tsubulata_036248 [Turnera subulata]|uniref:tRNA/rRNA methyltransferase SpoU type domain-containing protein n=1 Tax=Turnera subulata TaxID=218843 RepID=A0A9Q0G117_9ROSI|nr:hypothetical protein Tsubulata_036248 [Turnera subulata]